MESKYRASGKGGYREGAGRRPGSMSKLAKDAVEAAKASGELPHEFLLRVARGEPIYRTALVGGKEQKILEEVSVDKRIDAAKGAAPYYAPKISTVEVIHGISDENLDSIIAELAAQTGIVPGARREEAQDETGGGARRERRELKR